MRKLSLISIGLTVMLAGCGSTPASNPVADPVDPNLPDGYQIARICQDGTKVYLLRGGPSDGKYAIVQSTARFPNGEWIIKDDAITLENFCPT